MSDCKITRLVINTLHLWVTLNQKLFYYYLFTNSIGISEVNSVSPYFLNLIRYSCIANVSLTPNVLITSGLNSLKALPPISE